MGKFLVLNHQKIVFRNKFLVPELNGLTFLLVLKKFMDKRNFRVITQPGSLLCCHEIQNFSKRTCHLAHASLEYCSRKEPSKAKED